MAQKLPSGKYRQRVTYTDEAGRRRSVSFTRDTAKQADYAALEFSLSQKRTAAAAMTVGEAVQRYIDNNDAVFSPSTLMGYRKIARCYFTAIEKAPLERINSDTAQRWVNDLARKHSPKTVSNAYGLLSAVLRTFAPNISLRVQLPKKKQEDVKIPQPDEIAQLIRVAEGTTMYLPILLGAYCGLRRSEMAALTWDDIDLKKREIKVREALVRGDYGWSRKSPKTTAGYRTLNMPQLLYDCLQKADKTKPPVVICPDTITKRFNAICKQCGMDYNVHLLRHYFASVCAALGLPALYTIKLMGHSSDTMVKRVYGHTFEQQELAARDRLAQHFDTAVP